MSANHQHRSSQSVPVRPPQRQRLRISNACLACRLRKVKCDGSRATCGRKLGKDRNCPSGPIPSQSNSGSRVKHQNPVQLTVANSHHGSRVLTPAPTLRPSPETPLTPSTASPTSTSHKHPVANPSNEANEQNCAYYTAHGRFAGEVAAAIDVRAGTSSPATSNLVPFVDAPLFGEVDLHAPYRVLNFAAELPPRSYADRLVSIYWQYVDPIEPILDRDRFFQDYNASYSKPGAPLNTNDDVWLSILNIVFALAVQRQESIPLQQRDEEGNRYFQHAWALLRPETILWKPGTLELVQCLMLMNRYLHCTSNQQKTWMTAGLAIRIAQSLCCHLPESSLSDCAAAERKLRRKVWASCVSLDRCVSWSLGRTSAPSLIPLPNRFGSSHLGSDVGETSTDPDTVIRGLELFEIGSQIQLAQTQTRNAMANKLGLPRLYQQEEYHVVAVQLESCLNKWEDALPNDWKLANLSLISDRASRAQRYLLHFRLMHSRIFLYRPLLARFYSMKTHSSIQNEAPISSSLSDRLLKECATSCIETAQRIISLITDTCDPNEPIGLLPWWYRIYYLHIAGITFLAAMITPELHTHSVATSWAILMVTLRAHEHLSVYVQQCSNVFETLSARILGTRQPKAQDSGNLELENSSCSFVTDDVMQDAGFDFNNFLFGTDDILL